MLDEAFDFLLSSDFLNAVFVHTTFSHPLSLFHVQFLVHVKSEVDYFIEKLEKTIQFFSGLQNPSDDDNDPNDDFVPFI
jgi:hypothetical protein